MYASKTAKSKKVFINEDCQTTMHFRIVNSAVSNTYAILTPQDSITEAKVYNENHTLIFILHLLQLTKDTCIFEGDQYAYNPSLGEYSKTGEDQEKALVFIYHYENNVLTSRKGFTMGQQVSKEPIEIGDTIYLTQRGALIPGTYSGNVPDYVAIDKGHACAYGVVNVVQESYLKMNIFSLDSNQLIRVSRYSSSPYESKPTYSGNQFLYDRSGRVQTQLVYDNNGKITNMTRFYPSGQVRESRIFTQPMQIKAYYESGELLMESVHDPTSQQTNYIYYAKDGTQIDEPENDDFLPVVVEEMPAFPGGQQALFNYLSKNVKYPKDAQNRRAQGRTICQFVVNKDGSITNVTVVQSSGDGSLDAEAVRVIRSMPKWRPGMQKGKRVRVRYTVPINFRL